MTIETMFRQPDFYNLSAGLVGGHAGAAGGVGHAGPGMHEPSKVEHLDPLVNQLCRVCDEPAAGFHFGAFTCEGCKSFFGRTCNNQSVIAECKNNYRCVVDKKNRTSCKACRLRKCLMVGMSKSGSRYGRRSNWFKIHCLMQANSNKRPPHPSPSLPPHPPHLTPSAPPPPVSSLSGSQESQLPPTLRWPMAPSLSRLSLPPLQVPQSPVPKSLSAFESYANLLKQAEAKMEKKTDDIEESDHISVSRSPSPQPQVSPSPLNISSISDTSSKSSHSLLSEENRNNILEINKNLGSFGQQSPDLSKLPSGTPSHPLFPFGLSPPQMPPSLSHLYNPLSFAASPLYRLSPLLAANSLFGNPLLMFGQKSHLDILEEHRKLIEKFGIASAASKSSEESFDEKPVKVEDPIDLTFKTSDDDKCEDDE